MDKVLTTEEVGKALAVGIGTVRTWIRTGELKATKLRGSRKWLVSKADFDAFVAARTK